MSLTLDQAKEILQNPLNQSEIKKGEKYQSRLRILTKAYSPDTIQDQSAWLELKTYLSNTLTTDKYNAIIKYFTFPLPVVNITNDILLDLYTVFNGRNASFGVEYPNQRFKEIATQQLRELDVRGWIEKQGKHVLQSAPNSITVVDLDENGNPILVLVQNEQLKGYEFNQDGSFKYVMFLHSKEGDLKRWAVYDDEYYRVFEQKDTVYTLIVENAHGLGYCPARFFYDKPLNNKYKLNRSIPLSNVVGSLYEWLLFHVFIYYAQHYGAFPAIEYADSGCEIDGCLDGVLQPQPIYNDNEEIISYTEKKTCPSCAKKGLIGPGTAIGIEVSEDAEIQDTRGVLRFVTPDVSSLQFLLDGQKEKENFIKVNTVGYNNVTTKEAVNEAQVRFLAESRMKAPREISSILSPLYVWIVETVHLLLYDTKVEVHANFGTEFLVLTSKDIMMLIQEAKKAGVQTSEIMELNKMLIQTKYKTDPNKVEKMLISSDLEPSPFDTREEAEKKYKDRMITPEDYYQKLNFHDLIRRFEIENGSIVSFGSELTYEQKIKRIKDTLLFYTNQKLESNENDTTEQVEAGATGASDN